MTEDSEETSQQAEQPTEIPIPEEVLERMPPPMQESIKETFGIISSGAMGNPIARKVTSEHVTKIIDNGESESKREHELAVQGQRYGFAYVVLAVLAFFVFALMFGKSDPELFKQTVAYLATFAAGFAGGWGIKAARGRSEE